MARYRKIYTRLWSDQWFRGLSQPSPSGAWLWIWLLCGPVTGVIPGLIQCGEGGLAEAIGWSIDDFRRIFCELSNSGKIRSSWVDRLVWIPNAMIYNPPTSLKVVVSWREAFQDVVECDLKNEIKQTITAFLSNLGIGYSQTFDQTPAKAILEAENDLRIAYSQNRNRFPASQDQDQDQDQDQKQDLKKTFDRFWTIYPRKVAKIKTQALWNKLQPGPDLIEKILISVEQHKQSAQWLRDNGQYIPHPTTWLGQRRWEDEIQVDPLGGAKLLSDGNMATLRYFQEQSHGK